MFVTCCGCSKENYYGTQRPAQDIGILERESATATIPTSKPETQYKTEAGNQPKLPNATPAQGDAGCTVLNNVEYEMERVQELSDITESNKLCAMKTVDCIDLFTDMGIGTGKQRMCKFDPVFY